MSNLQTTTREFLTKLLAANVDEAADHSMHVENSSNPPLNQVTYTFFPRKDSNAIFDVLKVNDDDPLAAQIVGEYENGVLVTFLPEHLGHQATNVDYLRDNKFKTHFICHFICGNNEWKISVTDGCFEDQGGPFYGPDGGGG